MSRQSTKAARRSTKTPRRTVKKTAKSVRKSARPSEKKAAKSARRVSGKATRPARPAALAAPSAAIKSTFKSATKMIRTFSPPMQPVAMADLPTMSHKYHVGETVYYTSPTFGRAAASGSYTVVKLLPSEGDDYQYRIKSSGEAFERVAKESQLDKV
jgi:hypothetical protein